MIPCNLALTSGEGRCGCVAGVIRTLPEMVNTPKKGQRFFKKALADFGGNARWPAIFNSDCIPFAKINAPNIRPSDKLPGPD